MKNKLLKIGAFGLLIHLILFFLFHFVNERKNPPVVKMKQLINTNKSHNIWIAGDSHSERSIDVNQIKNATSVAFYGENNIITYYKIKQLLKKSNHRPKYILFPDDLVTFTTGARQFRTQRLFYYQFIPLQDYKLFETKPIQSQYEFIKTKIFPYIEWQYALNLINKNRLKKNTKLFSNLNTAERNKETKELLKNDFKCLDKRESLNDSISLLYLNKTISLCKKHQIKPIFIKYPMTYELFNSVSSALGKKSLNEMKSDEIINKSKLPLINLERIFENNPELFFDCHHLNEYGKRKFTPILKQKLDSLLKVY